MTEIVERLRLPPEPSSAGAARRFVVASLGAGDEVAELAVLLVSELASNAVLHAQTPFEVAVHVGDERLRVEVSDADPTMPSLKTYLRDSITGRGLHMVAASADRWGFDARRDGKVVWFELLRRERLERRV
jgi:anti-sigma regulatory factor (Ser/Thr protein kinase)